MKNTITTLAQYQQSAMRTAPAPDREHDQQHALLGLISEVGEFADALKKKHAYGHPIDHTNLIEETGDILWFTALMCRALGTDLEVVANVNIAKLRARFPDKFTVGAALIRDLAAERAVLEGGVK